MLLLQGGGVGTKGTSLSPKPCMVVQGRSVWTLHAPEPNMEISRKISFKGVLLGIIKGSIVGLIQGDTRSLDYGSHNLQGL